MKLFSVQELRSWDKCTIKEQNISGLQLMEHAGNQLFKYIKKELYDHLTNVLILVGNGNNGGDGLVIAHLMHLSNIPVKVYLVGNASRSNENEVYIEKCKKNKIQFVSELNKKNYSLIIDALFGSGLSRPLKGVFKNIVNSVNKINTYKLAIDLPSGIHGDLGPVGDCIFISDTTLTIQQPKRSFYFPESSLYLGNAHIIDIGLSKKYYNEQPSNFQLIDDSFKIESHSRNKFSHKGNYGHVLLIAGSPNMIGASLLAAKAALRSGCGLVTALMPFGYGNRMNQFLPEAMVIERTNDEDWIPLIDSLKSPTIIIGPGLGVNSHNAQQIEKIFKWHHKPMVIDADALNIISKYKLINKIPANSILTPHTGEFIKLFGKSNNFYEQYQTQIKQAKKHQILIVHKYAKTTIVDTKGNTFINDHGSPGMATAGSGDVLSGVIGSLLAQGISPSKSAISGVLYHALAGEKSSIKKSEKNMIASDIIEELFII